MQPGRLAEKYTLLERIAEGSYGEVYKGQDRTHKQLVAIKRFKGATRVGLPTSFVREHYILSLLKGKHLPRLLDSFAGQDPAALVLEWLSMSLEQVVRSKKKYAIKQFFRQALQAVSELHARGVLHRDLKPANIMLACTAPGCAPEAEPTEISPDFYELKLIDFGMARQQAWEGREMTNQVGSLFYRAPELLAGDRRYRSAVDVWSLGCIFYFMQTGNTLFRASSETEQFRGIVTVVGEGEGVKNGRLRQALKTLKMEKAPAHWQSVEKNLNEIDLAFLKGILRLEPQLRPSCQDLLAHPYFADQ